MSGLWRVFAWFSAPSRRRTCLFSAFLISTSALRPAAAAETHLDLPAQPLSSALITLATKADVSIGLSGVSLTGKTARRLTTYASFEDALTQLLAGSGLGFTKVDETTYRIFEIAKPRAASDIATIVPLQRPPIEELTITATKRAEALQNVPISAAIIKTGRLNDYGLRTSDGAASLFAGLSSTHQNPGSNKFFVRGLADSAFTGNTQSAVGVYIDETRAVFNAPDPNLRLVDIDRVEVIRGPQGTLYGAGSIGGLVRVITKVPVFGKLESEVTADGSLGSKSAPSGGMEGVLNIPIGENFALRGVAYGQHDGGYINNTRLRESKVNNIDTTGTRLAARGQLSQDWTVGASVIWQSLRVDDSQYYDRAMPSFSRGNRLHEPSSNEFLDVNVSVNGDLGWGELVSSTAWIAQNVDKMLDASLALPALIGRPPQPTAFQRRSRYRTINHESRLISEPGPKLQWLAGAFYSRRRESAVGRLDLLSLAPAGIFYSKNRHDSGTEMALFGELSYTFAERFVLTGGLRGYRGIVYAAADNSELIDEGPTEAVGKNARNGVTPKVTLSYKISPEHMVYAEAAQGFRLGGVNIDSRVANPTIPRRGPALTVRNFNSDSLWNFEIGSKSILFDQKLTLNTSAFYAVWRNMQADLARNNGLLFTANLGKVENVGFEIETVYAPSENFRAFANVAWSNPELTESNALLASISANRLPIVPKLSSSIAAQYQKNFADDYLGFVNVKCEIMGSARLTNTANPMAMTSSYQVLSSRAGVQHDSWKMSLYVNNIFNTGSNTYAFGNPFSFGRISQVTPLRPRTVGLTLTWAQ